MFQVFLPKKSKKNCRHLLACSCSCWPWAGSPTCASMQMKTDRNVIPTFFSSCIFVKSIFLIVTHMMLEKWLVASLRNDLLKLGSDLSPLEGVLVGTNYPKT